MPERGSYEIQGLDGTIQGGEYRFLPRTGSLREHPTGKPIATVSHHAVAANPLPWPSGADAGRVKLPCIRVVDSEIMAEMQRPSNAGAIFVVPCRFNGTAFPNNMTVCQRVDDYINRNSGGARAQLALHPGLTQFLLDNAATVYNPDGLNLASAFVNFAKVAGIKSTVGNGFLSLDQHTKQTEEQAATLAQQLHHLQIMVLKGVPVTGLAPDLQNMSEHTHHVNVMSVCAVPFPGQARSVFEKQAAVGFLAAQYYGALRLAASQKVRCKIFLMPAGTRESGNSMRTIANAMSLAVEMLNLTQRGLLDIHALTWVGLMREHDQLAQDLKSCNKLLDEETFKQLYGPDGMPKEDGVPIEAPMHTGHQADQSPAEVAAALGKEQEKGVEIEEAAWFRGDHSRLEMNRRGALSVGAVCSGLEEMWRKGLCDSRRWTNDREVCNVPGLPEDVVDFPLDDSSLLVPRSAGGRDGKLRAVVGDQVRVVCENPEGHFDPDRVGTVGHIGKVLADDGRTRGLPTFQVQLESGKTFWYEEEWITEDRGRATKGDKVRIFIENVEGRFDPSRVGTRQMVGTVVMDYGPGPDSYDVHFANGPTLQYDDTWVAPIAPIPVVGDKVQIMIDGPLGIYDQNRTGTLGQAGVVLQTDCSPLPVLVHFHDGAQLLFDDSWLERIPPTRLRIAVKMPDGYDNYHGLRDINGDYMIDESQDCAGMPVWVQIFDELAIKEGNSLGTAVHVIHTDAKGRWAVTKMPENQTLVVSRPHGGCCPQSAEQWGVIRIGSFLPVEMLVRSLSLVPLPEWPIAPPRPKPKPKAGCAKSISQGAADGCYNVRAGCTDEAFCMPPPPKHRGDAADVEYEAPQPPEPSRAVWRLDPFEELRTSQGKATDTGHTRRWVRLIDFGPTSGPGCSGAACIWDATSERTHCGRVFQGRLDNAYFVEALNAITLRPKLVRRLFYAWNVDFSAYAVRLYINGTWVCVEIDDFVPACDQPGEESMDDKPFSCYSEHFPTVLWPSLVEKAYGKACTLRDHGVWKAPNNSGGWEAIGGGGRVDEALADLTGGVSSSFRTADVAADRLFIYLYELQRDCLFVCRVHHTHCIRNGVRLHPLAHYAVNRAVYLTGSCYVQIFCSSPEGIFSGGLDDPCIIPYELLTDYPEKPADGFFWLNIVDFHYYFETIYECRLVNSPDVGLPGMPPPRLPLARNPYRGNPFFEDDSDVIKKSSLLQSQIPGLGPISAWASQNEGNSNNKNDSSGFGNSLQKSSKLWPPRSMISSLQLANEAFEGMPLMEDDPLQRPIYFEQVFANAGVVTEHRPPEFTVKLPAVPCEIVACLEQTCTRIMQIGPNRPKDTAVLLKVYEQLENNVYSNEIVCKSNWMPVRGSMVSFKSSRGGTFRIIGEMVRGARCERLVFRCYSSVPEVVVTAAAASRKHLLAEPPGPPSAVKWTLVGCERPERMPRADMPLAPEHDLDTLRKQEEEASCSVM